MARFAAALVTGALLAPTVPAAAAEPVHGWRYLLDRAAQAAEERAYIGEALWVAYDDGTPSVSTFSVQSSGHGEIAVTDPGGYAMRLADDGSGLADHERGWFLPLPAADLAKAHKGLTRLEEKYRVAIVGTEELLDRPCTVLEITRRADAQLVERLWIDEASGLLLRRETYDGATRLLRMVAYQKLDLDPSVGPRRAAAAQRPTRGQRPSMVRRSQTVAEVDEQDRAVLREAGWTVPDALPGGYRPDGSFAVSTAGSEPLQVVYGDGLYTVSLFEQRGRPDRSSLPDGAVKVDDLGFEAYTWPGTLPRRFVWEASGTTFSLVGDAPPQELRAMAASLPRPAADGLLERLRRGLGRLWSWVSPWA